jgi:hypothetical protein
MFTEMRMVRRHPNPLPQEREEHRTRFVRSDPIGRLCPLTVSTKANARGHAAAKSQTLSYRAPSPGAADEVSAKDKSKFGRGEGGCVLKNFPKSASTPQ